MRRALLALSAVLLMGVGPLAADPALDIGPQPFALIRTLQVLQEQVAHGNPVAQAAQPQLMRHIAERFAAVDPAAWKDERNGRAAVLFLLSGGRPAVIRAVLHRASVAPDLDRLLTASLAYAEGQDDVARTLFKAIDPRSLPAALGGHVALVKATLMADKDGGMAEQQLDLARLLVPGTLVEEAALRRQVFLLADKDTIDKFAFLSRQYVRRFRKSVYAENFKQRFTAAATRIALLGDLAQMSKLDPVLAELPPEEQRSFYLSIARTALVQGRTVPAKFAATRAAALADQAGPDGTRAKVYLGAAMIVSDEVDKGVTLLRASDEAQLTPQDADLRQAALTVARSVQAEDPEAGRDDDPDTGPGAKPDAATLALMDQARKAIEDGDKLLRGRS